MKLQWRILKNGSELLCNIIASQINSHKRFGGVVPEIASRHHDRTNYRLY